MTRIEWTDRTWNPTTGCDRVGPGCDNCYAATFAARLKTMGHPKYRNDGDPRTSGPGFGLTVHPHTLHAPLQWATPCRVFVDSMSDLFHPEVPDQFIAQVFAVMAQADWHTFQILTKRPRRMAEFVADECRCGHRGHAAGVHLRSAMSWAGTRHSPRYAPGIDGHEVYFRRPWPLANVWLGTSIETDTYTWRANHLRDTPAAVRFLSLEPLLGPLPSLDLGGIDWVIAGGESGRWARPMHPDWVRDIRDRCQAAGVAFFFKQWGTWLPVDMLRDDDGSVDAGRDNHHLRGVVVGGGIHRRVCWLTDDGTRTARDPGGDAIALASIGKRWAGRTIDGRTWDQFPDTGEAAER